LHSAIISSQDSEDFYIRVELPGYQENCLGHQPPLHLVNIWRHQTVLWNCINQTRYSTA